MGVVHGGTYASLSETVCSYGANYDQLGTFVGVNNNTDFIKSASSGDLICEARPISKGNTYQLWECKIYNNDILCAVSKVRLQKKTKALPTPSAQRKVNGPLVAVVVSVTSSTPQLADVPEL